MDTDVVVAGAGPVGLMLACELRLQGIDTVLIERLPEPANDNRAQALHGRTVPVLDHRGLLPRFRAAERELNGGAGGGNDSHRKRPLPKGHFAGITGLRPAAPDGDPEVPAVVFVPQYVTTRLLSERAAELGVAMYRGSEITAVAQDPDGVTVRTDGRSAPARLRARYLVGCDGARSLVRRQSGIGFEGSDASLSTLAAEVRLDDLTDVPTGWHRTQHGCTVISPHPEGGHSRVVVIDFAGPDPDREAPVTLAELRERTAAVLGREIPMSDLKTAQRYGDAARLADRYRAGRIFLAGDAAHIHYPVGGQGLNIGLQDAVNLGWKLAGQMRGWAPVGLLDTYHSERHPVAAAVLTHTRAQVALLAPGPRTDALRDLFTELIGFEQVSRYLSEKMSAADVRYDMGGAAPDPLTGRFAPSLRLETAQGTRRLADLMRHGRPVLLDLTDPAAPDPARPAAAAAPWADRVDVHTGRCPGHPGYDAVLVRPDGYVAWACDPEDAPDWVAEDLTATLRRWFGAPGRRPPH
ncbi:FAD-dependent monooxygenase [Streptomyces sp. NPDC050610]|uniref:FAD-dependent monooxygenase n=1 Tax=Streptomyces sp. NPDC050610 TaxID=3157097 RepID=UPI00341FE17E